MCLYVAWSNGSPDLQAPVLCRCVVPDIVLPLKFLHYVSKLFQCLKGLFGFLNGELGVVLLLPLRALVHRHTGTSIYREDRHHYAAWCIWRVGLYWSRRSTPDSRLYVVSIHILYIWLLRWLFASSVAFTDSRKNGYCEIAGEGDPHKTNKQTIFHFLLLLWSKLLDYL